MINKNGDLFHENSIEIVACHFLSLLSQIRSSLWRRTDCQECDQPHQGETMETSMGTMQSKKNFRMRFHRFPSAAFAGYFVVGGNANKFFAAFGNHAKSGWYFTRYCLDSIPWFHSISSQISPRHGFAAIAMTFAVATSQVVYPLMCVYLYLVNVPD